TRQFGASIRNCSNCIMGYFFQTGCMIQVVHLFLDTSSYSKDDQRSAKRVVYQRLCRTKGPLWAAAGPEKRRPQSLRCYLGEHSQVTQAERLHRADAWQGPGGRNVGDEAVFAPQGLSD